MGTSVDDMVLLDGSWQMITAGSRIWMHRTSESACQGPFCGTVSKKGGGCCENVITTLAKAGVTIVEMDPVDIWEDDAAASLPIVLYESMKELALYAESRGVAFSEVIDGVASPDVKAILESQLGEEAVTESVYRAAMETHRPNMQRKWQAYFDEHNLSAALFPTTALTALWLGKMKLSP